MTKRVLGALVSVTVALTMAVEAGDAWARARGGGSRGSRSFSAPRAAPTPSGPSQAAPSRGGPSFSYRHEAPASPGAATTPQPQRRGFFSGFGGALAGFALGGLLGSMLFGGAGSGFGIGLMDLVIVGGLAFVAWQVLRRRAEAAQPGHATAGAPARHSAATPLSSVAVTPGAHGGEAQLGTGIGHIRQMDAGFDPEGLIEWARTFFLNVQSCVALRDVGMIRDRLTPEMYNVLQNQCRELRSARRTNYVDKVSLDGSPMTEAWQEGGHDFVTVSFTGTMLDYTVEDATGDVVEGSKTDTQNLEESWTFTRPVGPNKWKLCAIQSA